MNHRVEASRTPLVGGPSNHRPIEPIGSIKFSKQSRWEKFDVVWIGKGEQELRNVTKHPGEGPGHDPERPHPRPLWEELGKFRVPPFCVRRNQFNAPCDGGPLACAQLERRQAADLVCGGGSRVSDGQKPGTASGASRARNVPRSERGVGGRGAVAVRRRSRRIVRCGAVAVQDPALCERNGEALQTRQSQAVYSEFGGCA